LCKGKSGVYMLRSLSCRTTASLVCVIGGGLRAEWSGSITTAWACRDDHGAVSGRLGRGDSGEGSGKLGKGRSGACVAGMWRGKGSERANGRQRIPLCNSNRPYARECRHTSADCEGRAMKPKDAESQPLTTARGLEPRASAAGLPIQDQPPSIGGSGTGDSTDPERESRNASFGGVIGGTYAVTTT
jgi:hypothetical protein